MICKLIQLVKLIISFWCNFLYHIVNTLVSFPYFVQLFSQKLSIWEQGHQHFEQQIVLFQKVLIGEFQFASRRELFLPVHQYILTQQISEDLILFPQVVKRKINGNQRYFQTFEQVISIEIFCWVFCNCPKHILVAELVYLLKRKWSFQLIVNSINPFPHLFLLFFQILQMIFHLFLLFLGIFYLSVQISLNFFPFLFYTFELLVQLFLSFLKTHQFFIFLSIQLFIKLLNILLDIFESISHHFFSEKNECPSCILSFNLFQNSDHILQFFVLSNDNSCTFELEECTADFPCDYFSHNPDSFSEFIVDRVLIDISPFSQSTDSCMQDISLFSQHKISQKFDGDTSLFLQDHFHSIVFLFLGYKCNPSYILECLPFHEIILPFEYILNQFLHSTLDEFFSQRKQIYSFKSICQARCDQSSDNQSDKLSLGMSHSGVSSSLSFGTQCCFSR